MCQFGYDHFSVSVSITMIFPQIWSTIHELFLFTADLGMFTMLGVSLQIHLKCHQSTILSAYCQHGGSITEYLAILFCYLIHMSMLLCGLMWLV
jgi:hypothetical protein